MFCFFKGYVSIYLVPVFTRAQTAPPPPNTMLLQVSTPLHALSRRLSLSSSLTLFRTQRTRSLSCKMSAESAPLTHSITSPSRPGESVQIVASPGISDSEFRRVLFFVSVPLLYNFASVMFMLIPTSASDCCEGVLGKNLPFSRIYGNNFSMQLMQANRALYSVV